MNNKGTEISREDRFRELFARYMRNAAPGRDFADADHLDGDDINAFIEGGLSESAALPITSHLAACGFCRHRSAELIRLHYEFADEPAATVSAAPAPTKVSEVLSGILEKIFGPAEGAVFAHEEKEEKRDEEE